MSTRKQHIYIMKIVKQLEAAKITHEQEPVTTPCDVSYDEEYGRVFGIGDERQRKPKRLLNF